MLNDALVTPKESLAVAFFASVETISVNAIASESNKFRQIKNNPPQQVWGQLVSIFWPLPFLLRIKSGILAGLPLLPMKAVRVLTRRELQK